MQKLDNNCYVSGQIDISDLSWLAESGVDLIINNRVDYESPGQPSSAQTAAEVERAGARYHHLPMGDLTVELIHTARDLLDRPQGNTLLFCKAGMRSTMLWAAARVAGGREPDDVVAACGQAGFELRPYRTMLAEVAALTRVG